MIKVNSLIYMQNNSWSKFIKIPIWLSGHDVKRILNKLNLEENSRVLDAGSGLGRISKYLQDKEYNVISIDKSPTMVNETKKRGVNNVILTDILFFNSKDKFDLVVTDGLLEHEENPEIILQKLKSLSCKYVVNFIPKNNFINKFLEGLQHTPDVYWKNKYEWYNIHHKVFDIVDTHELLRLYGFVCKCKNK